MEHIIAAVRIKPSSSQEDRNSARSTQDVWEIRKDSIQDIRETRELKIYRFDFVFTESSTNDEVFQNLAKPMLDSALNGINCTIFAYGQTSSGKTHTIRGSVNDPGLIPQSISLIFDSFSSSVSELSVKISYLEIYNEKVNDLLDPSKVDLTIREHPEKGFFVKELTETSAENKEKALELLSIGERNRKYAGTQMNKNSSRSHCIFRVTVENSNAYLTKQAQINFIDLAGSECVTKTGADEDRLEEGNNINRSLLGLGRLIRNLNKKGKGGHLGYRDTVLTKVLKPALSGNFWTAVICTINPEPVHYHESKNTLDFGVRSRMLENKIEVNTKFNESNIEFLNSQKDEIKKLLQKTSMLEEENSSLACLNQKLEEFKRNLEDENNNARVLIHQLMQENSHKEVLVIEARNQVGEKELQVSVLKDQISQADANEAEMRTRIFELEGLNHAMNIKGLEVEANNAQMISQISALESLSRELNAKLIDLEGRNRQMEVKVSDIEGKNNQLKMLEPQINQLNDQLKKASLEINELLSVKSELEKQIKDALEDNHKIVQDLDRKTLEIENLSKRLTKQKTKNDYLSESLYSETLKASGYLESLNILQKQLILKDSESSNLSIDLASANLKITELTSTLSDFQSLTITLKDQVLKLSSSLSEIESSLNQELESKQEQINSKDLEISKLRVTKEDHLKNFEDFQVLTKKNEELEKKLKETTNDYQKLQESFAGLTAEYSSSKDFSAKTIKEFLDNDKRQRVEISSLKSMISGLEDQVKATTSKISKLILTEISLNEEINKFEDTLKENHAQISKLKTKIRKLETEKAELHQELDLQVREKNLIEAEKYNLEFHCSKNEIILHPDEKNRENTIIRLYHQKLLEIDALITEKEELILKTSQLSDQLRTYELMQEQSKAEIDKLRKESNCLRVTSNQSEKKISDLNRIISKKRSSMGCVGGNTSHFWDNKENFLIRFTELETENKKLYQEKLDIYEKLDQSIVEVSELQQKLQLLKNENTNFSQKMLKLQEENRSLFIQKTSLLKEKESKVLENSVERGNVDRNEMKFKDLGATPKCKVQ